MALKTRKTIILAKVESTYGTDATPDGTNNAILVSEPSITPLAGGTVSRNNARPYLGASQEIHVGSHVMVSFKCEIAGGGGVDTPPPWGVLLEGCGMAETINASTSVEYDPISASEDSLTIYFHRDGQKHALTGARGTFTVEINKNAIPYLNFSFTGIYNAPASTADPTPVFTAWQTPIPVSNTNTPTVALHSYDCILESCTIDMGIQIQHSDRPNEEVVNLLDRDVGGSITFSAPTLTAKNFYTIAKANTLSTLSLVHGTATGNIVTISSDYVQLLNPTYGDVNGETTLQANLKFVPSDSGNDEIQITTT